MTTPPVVVLNKMFAGAISVNSVVLCLLIQLLDHPYSPPHREHNFILLAGGGCGLEGVKFPHPLFRVVIYFLQIDANSLNGGW